MTNSTSKNLGNILVTGGAGFIGTNLIKHLIENYKFTKIISIDNYYTGSKKNHFKHKKVIYINFDTKNILRNNNKILKNFKPKYIFHFAEFSRIVPSFKYIEDCFSFNRQGTLNIILYAIKKKSKLIYSASSSRLGKEDNESLSPYSWSKSKNIELIKNFNKWFNLNFTIVYFFNVYGPSQIKKHYMSAVMGIFEDQYEKNHDLTVVKPGTQKRDFTHVNDIINGTILAAIKGGKKEYQLGSGKYYRIIDVAKMFKRKIKLVKERPGERFSALSNYNLAKKELGYTPKYNLEEYIKKFISKK
tara:strand:- start:52 stop:957 length:906 start_codon:yes stop_codon:yes gene_type:complete